MQFFESEIFVKLLSKPVREAFPDCVRERHTGELHFSAPYDYNPLLESMGFDMVVKVDDHNYQGDSRILFKYQDYFGILIFGWGSCSGCDALQACKSYEEVERLRDSLYNDVRWGKAEELLEYITTKDWPSEWYGRGLEHKQFTEKAGAVLMAEIS
jgi:hypothetical protein